VGVPPEAAANQRYVAPTGAPPAVNLAVCPLLTVTPLTSGADSGGVTVTVAVAERVTSRQPSALTVNVYVPASRLAAGTENARVGAVAGLLRAHRGAAEYTPYRTPTWAAFTVTVAGLPTHTLLPWRAVAVDAVTQVAGLYRHSSKPVTPSLPEK
jgi:hypothetical protein